MREFTQWFSEDPQNKKSPWLIVGKGPSFSKISDQDISNYHILSLNHAIRDLKAKVAHIIDFDVVGAVGEAIVNNAQYLVLPWHPHINHRPTEKTLSDLVAENPVLTRMQKENRLLWYNLQTTQDFRTGGPIIAVKYFSAEAAVNLLAESGTKSIRTLGVDGGKNYSQSFSDLNKSTLLANGHASFDIQFEQFAKTIQRTGIELGPLDAELPVRVYVGTTESQMLATRVLEYSIRKNASLSVEVIPLCHANISIPEPKDPANRPRTPFSFQRFLIPELNQFTGKAIYLDSDMLVFKDIRDLWLRSMGENEVLSCWLAEEGKRIPQFSVMLMDCSKLRWSISKIVEQLDSNKLDYESLVYHMSIAKKLEMSIEPQWNCLERFRVNETALLHYTDMDRQPWVKRHNPLGHHWCQTLLEAIDSHFISRDEVEEHVAKQWVRPSLLYQIDSGIVDPRKLPRKARLLDSEYRSPVEQQSPNNPPRFWWYPLLSRLKQKVAGP